MTDTHIDVDQDALVADLAAMIRIPSVNYFADADPAAPPEAAMSDHFAQQLRALGLEVHSKEVVNGRRNVWGVLKGSGQGPTVMLAGHLDTVGVTGYDAPFAPRIADGKIYGRGACDMKAGLAAYLEVLRILQRTGTTLAGDLIVAGVVDEEHAMTGSYDFGMTGPPVDFAIVAEPSSLAICPTHKGQVCRSIRTKGVSVHSSVPEKGVNAIFHMSRILEGLRDLADKLSRAQPHPMCGTPSLSVGVINGGTNVSSVPDWCEISVDRRTVPGETFQSTTDEMQAILDAVAASTEGLKAQLAAPELNVDPFSTDLASPIVQSITQACTEVTGQPAEIAAFTGSTDAPNFRCPAVICGAGSLAQCHSLNEYVEIDQLVAAVKIYVRTLQLLQPTVS